MSNAYLDETVAALRRYKTLAEYAVAQVADADLHKAIDPEANSIAIVMRHMAGNLRSRFTDFLTTDGEKPNRRRDGEFEMPVPATRDEMLADWESGWAVLFAAIEPLGADDLAKTIHIRGEAFLVPEALSRAYGHAAYHVGQIVLLAKHCAGPSWMSLTIPKGQSETFKGGFKQTAPPPTRS